MTRYAIHIDSDSKKNSEDIQVSAAAILVDYFHSDITFIHRVNHMQTADFLIKGQIWEHKAPRGNGKRTIQNSLRNADNQSTMVIIDLRRCKLHPAKALSNIRHELERATKIKKLLVITKTGKVIVIK